jgi:hypothetical protein
MKGVQTKVNGANMAKVNVFVPPDETIANARERFRAWAQWLKDNDAIYHLDDDASTIVSLSGGELFSEEVAQKVQETVNYFRHLLGSYELWDAYCEFTEK